MSRNRIVGLDNPRKRLMRALTDTAGMLPPEQAAFWLEKLAFKAHRGARIDTWESARNRAARLAGISPTIAARIWHRYRTMKVVSFEVGLKLMLAYEAMCDGVESAADAIHSDRMALGEINAATKQGSVSAGQGMGAAPGREGPGGATSSAEERARHKEEAS